MSDVMLLGVLRMPYELAMHDDISRLQLHSRCKEAADRIESNRAEIERLEKEVEKYKDLNEKNKDVAARVILQKFDLLGKLEASENTAWNEAIEEAATEVNTLAGDDETIRWAVRVIRSLRRSAE